jgi:vitamin B12 transporter
VSAGLPCAPDGGCSLQLRSTLLEEQTTLTDPRIELRTLRAPWLHSRGQRVGHSIGLSLRPTSSWQLGVNAGYVDELLVLDRAQSSARRALRNGATLALDSQVRPTDAWLLYGMLHAQCERTHGSLQQENGWNEVKSNECADLPEARLGSSMDLNPWLTVLANLSHNVRPPTLGERYGTSPTINGNAGLLREDSINADFGVRSTWASAAAELGLDAFAFGRWSKDLVRYRRTSLNAFSPYNVARGRVLGLEVDATGRFWRYLEMRTGVTAMQPMETTPDDVDTTPNDVLPLSSRLHLSQWLGVAAPWERFRLARAALGLRYMFMSSRYLDPSGLVVLPAREDWSLAADLRWSRPDIAARLAIENVLNARQQDLIGLPLPGRTFHVALEAWW